MNLPHELQASSLKYFKGKKAIFSVLDSITDAFVFLDNDYNVVFWNGSAEKITSLSREDVINKNLWDIFPASRGTEFEKNYERSKRENIPIEFEVLYEPTGSWFEVKTYPSPEGLAVYFKNITAKKKFALEMASQKNQNQAVIDASPDSIWSVDKNYRLLTANKVFLDNAYYYSGKKMAPGDSVFIMGEEEKAKWKPLMDRAFAGESFRHELLLSYSVTGESVYSELSFYPIIDEETKEVTGAACNARDITDSRRYIRLIEDKNRKLQEQEKALRNTTEQLETILHYSPDMIASVDFDGNYASMNQACSIILGYQPEEMIGKHFSTFVFEEDIDKTLNISRLVREGKRVTAFRNRLVKKNGALVPVIWSAVWDKEKERVFCVARDATVLYQAEQEKLKSEQKLTEAFRSLTRQNEILKEIAFIQSHEVRRPLANILGLIQLVSETGFPPESRANLELLKGSCAELDEMIRTIVSKSFMLTQNAESL